MNPKLGKKARLRWDARSEQYMLVYPERGLLLNKTATEIVKLCDGTRSVEEIVATFAGRGDLACGEVSHFLEELKSRNLLE